MSEQGGASPPEAAATPSLDSERVVHAPLATTRAAVVSVLAAAGFNAEAKREFEAALALDPQAAFARANLCRVGGC